MMTWHPNAVHLWVLRTVYSLSPCQRDIDLVNRQQTRNGRLHASLVCNRPFLVCTWIAGKFTARGVIMLRDCRRPACHPHWSLDIRILPHSPAQNHTVYRWFAQCTYDSRKLTRRFAQDDLRNRGWFAQFYGCFAQASCYVVFLSN